MNAGDRDADPAPGLPDPVELARIGPRGVAPPEPGCCTRGVSLLDEFRALVVRHAGGGGQRAVRVLDGVPLDAAHTPTVLDGVSLTAVREPTLPIGTMAEPTFALVGQGVKRTTLNGTPYDCGTGQYLVVPVDLPVTGQALRADADAPLVVFSMRLRPESIAPLLLETGAVPRAARPAGLAVGTAPPELLDPVVRLLRLLDHPDDLAVLAAGLQREILWRLITGDQGALVRRIGLADGHLAHIARAIRWIRTHYDQPLLVADLAAVAGMSESAFRRHFRAATSMTPIEFRREIRLREARILLGTRTADIAEIGYRVGYESASQFNREYHRTFGISPGRDAVRLRSVTGRR